MRAGAPGGDVRGGSQCGARVDGCGVVQTLTDDERWRAAWQLVSRWLAASLDGESRAVFERLRGVLIDTRIAEFERLM